MGLRRDRRAIFRVRAMVGEGGGDEEEGLGFLGLVRSDIGGSLLCGTGGCSRRDADRRRGKGRFAPRRKESTVRFRTLSEAGFYT